MDTLHSETFDVKINIYIFTGLFSYLEKGFNKTNNKEWPDGDR